jgi:hypothetical protein
MSIHHIAFFTTDFCGLKIPGIEPRSFSLLLRRSAIADPGCGTRLRLPPPLTCGIPRPTRTHASRCGTPLLAVLQNC